MAGFEIKDPPTSGITKVQFGGNFAQFLLASSWDRKVRLYDVNKNSIRFEYTHDLPVFDCCLIDNIYSFSGGLDCILRVFDFNSQKSDCLGQPHNQHSKAIRCVRHCQKLNSVITGGWDCMVKMWDGRDRNQIIMNLTHVAKVYAMDCANDKLVVGTSDRRRKA